MQLRMRETIAGAIAREIHRTEIGPHYRAPDGVSYKSVLIERGANFSALCDESRRDFEIMRRLVSDPRFVRHSPRSPWRNDWMVLAAAGEVPLC